MIVRLYCILLLNSHEDLLGKHKFCVAHEQAPQTPGFDQLSGCWHCVAMKCYLLAVLLLHSTFLETCGYEWMVELQDLINFFYTEELVYEDLQDTNIIFDSE